MGDVIFDSDDYESLPESASPLVHALAGSLAGVCEHTIMFPLDVVKTRLQRIRPSLEGTYEGPLHGIQTIWKREGGRALFRGIEVTALGAGPAHAMYFTAYEQAKLTFGVSDDPAGNIKANAGAAVVATVAHEATMNPIEVVKQRLQLHGSPYQSGMHCFRDTLEKEGPIAFYRSFSTQMAMSIPFQCTHLIIYEQLRARLNPDGKYDPCAHLLAGAGAGAVASAVTNPFDVTKTLLNTQEPLLERQRIAGMARAFRTVYQMGGFAAFAKGLSARVCLSTPATAISWSVYEFFKHILGEGEKTDSSV